MEQSPAVTVITIFYDEERFLAEAVESVLAQTFGDWELLLCDDGSSDGSPAIARAYAEAHPGRIRVLQHPGGENRGMSATRNLGLAHARGELIAFLDADDVWLPNKLAMQRTALDAHPEAAMVYGPTLYWHSWTGRPEDTAHDGLSRLAASPNRLAVGSDLLARIVRGRGEPPCTCSILARREAVEAVGGFEDRFTGLFEDQAFVAKSFLRHDVFVMGECLDLYRQHPASSCAVATRSPDALRRARLAYLDWLRDYLERQGADRRLRRAVHHEQWIERRPALVEARSRAREIARAASGRFVESAFAAARLVLPRSLRQRLWRAFPKSPSQPYPPNSQDG